MTGVRVSRLAQLVTVCVLQFLLGLSDRQAEQAVRCRIDVTYAMARELDDPGFHHCVLADFRDRLAEGNRADRLLDLALVRLEEAGLVRERTTQRTDQWTAARREAYANDLGAERSLVAVTAKSNRSKSDQEPSTWLPPLADARCTYAAGRREAVGTRPPRRRGGRVPADSPCSGMSVPIPTRCQRSPGTYARLLLEPRGGATVAPRGRGAHPAPATPAAVPDPAPVIPEYRRHFLPAAASQAGSGA
ncbi:transposase [Streptomyces sp. NBC_00344]|uniref:transposase n=1 Tax=Streptomyces sp. NBC_00344 TaxID=2975720 RepID=UPI002E20AB63